MKVTVIGCGRWGSTITWYLDSIGNTVTLYGRATSPHMQQFMADRTNDFLRLPESITLTNDLDCVKDAEVIVISVNSQGLQKVFDELKKSFGIETVESVLIRVKRAPAAVSSF